MRDEMREMKGLLLNHLKLSRANLFKEMWVDGPELCAILHIDMRKLRTLRKKGLISYTTMEGKPFYNLADVHKLFKSNYCNNQSIQKP